MSSIQGRGTTPPRLLKSGTTPLRSAYRVNNNADELTRLYELEVELAMQRKELFNEDLQRRRQAAIEREEDEKAKLREHHQRLHAIRGESSGRNNTPRATSRSPARLVSKPDDTRERSNHQHIVTLRSTRPSSATDAASKAVRTAVLHRSLKEWSKADEERVETAIGGHEAVIGSAEVPIFVHTSESRSRSQTPPRREADPLEAYSNGFVEYQARRGEGRQAQKVDDAKSKSPVRTLKNPSTHSSSSDTDQRKGQLHTHRTSQWEQSPSKNEIHEDDVPPKKDLTSSYLGRPKSPETPTREARRSQRRRISPPKDEIKGGYHYPSTNTGGSLTTNGQYGAAVVASSPPINEQRRTTPSIRNPTTTSKADTVTSLKQSIQKVLVYHSGACADAVAEFRAFGQKTAFMSLPSPSAASEVASELIGLVSSWANEPLEKRLNPQQNAKFLETIHHLISFATSAWLKLELAPTAENLSIAEAVKVRGETLSRDTSAMVTPLCFQLLGILSIG